VNSQPLAKYMTWNITLRMRRWREVSDFASQKIRLTSGRKRPGQPNTRTAFRRIVNF